MDKPNYLKLVDDSAPAPQPEAFAPSQYQLDVWDHLASRKTEHLVVEALAGSGKTTTLVRGLDRIPYAQNGIALTSFGRDIVDELRTKVPPHLGPGVRTLHGLGVSALYTWLKGSLASKEVDKHKAARHAAAAFNAVNLSVEQHDIAEMCRALAWAKCSMIASVEAAAEMLDEVGLDIPTPAGETDDLATQRMAAGALVINALNRCATDLTSFDYDDMIWMPLVRNLPLRKFDHVLVDECQDLSYFQILFARQLLAHGGRIIGVGDSKQAIYAFRGADSQAMTRIVQGLSARTLPLRVTYRCALSIVAEAQRWVPQLEAQPNAPEGIVRRCEVDEMMAQVRPGDFVLSRTNAPLAYISGDLHIRNIPCMQLGRDVAEVYIDLIRRSRQPTTDGLRTWLQGYLERKLKRVKKDARREIRDRIETIAAFALGYDTTREVIQHIKTIYGDEARQNSVVLSTVHKAKGKEADRVWLLWNTFLRRKGQEESNIAYVAVTRAKNELVYVDYPTKRRSEPDEEED